MISRKRISILGYGKDVYDTSNHNKDDSHYIEEFRCRCSEKCRFKYRIVLKAKSGCADVEVENKVEHGEKWKEDINKIRLDERIKSMIDDCATGKLNQKTTEIYEKKEEIRKRLKLSKFHGAFFISRSMIQNMIDTKK